LDVNARHTGRFCSARGGCTLMCCGAAKSRWNRGPGGMGEPEPFTSGAGSAGLEKAAKGALTGAAVWL
jgi:hypothetical protein